MSSTKRVMALRSAERIEIDGHMVHPTAPHGTRHAYNYYNCRCAPCCEARANVARTRYRPKVVTVGVRASGGRKRGASIREEWNHFSVVCGMNHDDAIDAVAAGLIPPIKPESVRAILARQDKKAVA